MKSTGESFSKKEQVLLKQSVVANVTSNDHDELWVFDFHTSGQAGNQIVIYISGNFPKSHYVEPIADAIDKMSEDSILRFSERIFALLEKGGKDDIPSKLADAVMKFGKTKNWKLLKRRIAALLDSHVYEIRLLEDQLHPHILSGRKYFHATYNSGIDFFSATEI